MVRINAAPYGQDDFAVSQRPTTEATVLWSPEPWNNVDDPRTSPDLSKILGEIVGREDWIAGNSLALMIEGSGLRTAVSFDGDPGGAPQLVIEYVVAE